MPEHITYRIDKEALPVVAALFLTTIEEIKDRYPIMEDTLAGVVERQTNLTRKTIHKAADNIITKMYEVDQEMFDGVSVATPSEELTAVTASVVATLFNFVMERAEDITVVRRNDND